MKPSRNRGVKKPKLRDYSHLVLAPEEKEALAAAAHSQHQHPIVIAILACVLIEHELDRLLRKKLKKNDENTWQALQSETGPLRSFAAKISTAYALGIYTEKIQHDLNVVRIIRNAFAHSKKLIDFDDPLIISELVSAHILRKKVQNLPLKRGPCRNGSNNIHHRLSKTSEQTTRQRDGRHHCEVEKEPAQGENSFIYECPFGQSIFSDGFIVRHCERRSRIAVAIVSARSERWSQSNSSSRIIGIAI